MIIIIIFLFQLQCSAQAKHDIIGSSTAELESSPFFLGIKIVSPPQLIIEESGLPKSIQITSTIPITCQKSSPVDSTGCCIDIQVCISRFFMISSYILCTERF